MILQRIAAKLDVIGRVLASLCCATLFLFLMSDIVLRKVGVSFLWPIEFNGFLMAFIVFLPMAGITRRREHLSADFFLSTVGGRFESTSRRLIIPAANLVFALLLLFLAWRTLSSSWLDETNSPGPLRTPMWIPQSVMVVSLAAMVITALSDLLRASDVPPAFDGRSGEGER